MNERFLPDIDRSSASLPVPIGEPAPVQAYEGPDAQSPFQLHALVWTIYRWRWLFLGAVFACLAIAAIYAATRVPLYRAVATLELNPAPAKVVDLTESEEARQNDQDYLALQIGLVKSRNVAETVARRLNLGRDERFLGGPVGDGRPGSAVGALMAGFNATGTTSDRIMRIEFIHPDPTVAAKVVNGFATQAVETNFERADEATARSRDFLRRRLETTRQELESSERQLIEYAREANIVNIVAGEGTATSGDSAGGTLLASRLVALNSQLADAQNARIVAQQRYAQSAGSAAATVASDATVQSLQQQRAQLQADYDQRLERYFPEHPEMVALRARISGLEQQIASASGRASSSVSSALRSEMVAAQNRENQLRAQVAQLQNEMLDLGDRGVRYNILRRAVDSQRSLYNALLERLGQENTSATRTSGVAVIDTAEVPGAPFYPNIPRTLILGLMAGLVLGSAGAIGAERWFDTIHSPDEVRKLLGLPVLGIVPKVKAQEEVDLALADPASSVSEAYHAVRASLHFVGGGRPPASLFLTSSKAGEGKTSSTIAIAAGLNSLGYRVLVVDADLRRPSFSGAGPNGGLVAVLSGRSSFNDEITATDTNGLYLLPAGKAPPDPTVLLSGAGFADLIRKLEGKFDVVVIDGPPVLGLADAPLIASAAQATVMVVQAGDTRRNVALNALRRLHDARAQVVGAILTKYDHKEVGYGYAYGYDYYQYGDSASKSRNLIGYQQPSPSADT